MRLLRTTSLALLVALVPLAACGDDDDSGDDPTEEGSTDGATSGDDGSGEESSGEELTKEEFIAQGDEVCQAALDAGEALEQPEQTAEDLSRYLEDATEVLDTAREDWVALNPPDDGEEVHELQTEALEESVAVLKEAKAKADEGDTTGAATIVSDADPEADSRGPLQAYGFEVCGVE